MMKWLIGCALLAVLLVGCGDDEPGEWIVTGTELSLTEQRARVSATISNGVDSGVWEWEIPPTTSDGEVSLTNAPWWLCWSTAEIGAAIPECMRSPAAIETDPS